MGCFPINYTQIEYKQKKDNIELLNFKLRYEIAKMKVETKQIAMYMLIYVQHCLPSTLNACIMRSVLSN